ncbi:MAG: citryl-CoA lyase [Planctomycetes bacterium]|nr:citryl-CoA lyase [Planctomycetota bacterium]
MPDAKTWPTAITKIDPNSVRVRGYDIAELMGNVSFGAIVHLILRGELPSPEVGRLMDAMVVAAIDHGATPPSALAARTVASTGAPLSASVAAGIASINRHHGGAIENCARTLAEVVEEADTGEPMDDAAAEVVNRYRTQKRRIAGFGHRIHSADPRTARLFELAREAGAFGRHCEAAAGIERALAAAGKTLPINVDGAMGAVLADLDFEPEVMNGLFMIARTSGLVAHVREEQTRMKPMRRIEPSQFAYDGPPPRSL